MRRTFAASSTGVAWIAAFAAGALVASCMTFNGVNLPAQSDSGGGGDSTTPPDAGGDAPAGDATPDGPTAQTYLPLATAAKLCSRIFACPYLSSSIQNSNAVLADPTNYSLCVHWLAGPLPSDRLGISLQQQTFQCMASASSCTQAGECVSYETLAPGDPRCAADAGVGDGGPRCTDDGGTILGCSGLYALHCNSPYYAAGTSCLLGADGTLGCALGTNCTVNASCIGSSLFDECGTGNNLHFQLNCPYAGYDCNTTQDGGLIGCLTGNQSLDCTALGTQCVGDVVQVCDGVNWSAFDCAALGGTCSSTGGSAICVSSGDQCTPFDPSINQCSGTNISLCVGGKKQTFDCASVGLTCLPGTAVSAHCG